MSEVPLYMAALEGNSLRAWLCIEVLLVYVLRCCWLVLIKVSLSAQRVEWVTL
jgi:hypothetical protein